MPSFQRDSMISSHLES